MHPHRAPPVFAGLAPEFRLLCLAARGGGGDGLSRACAEISDWSAVWSGARRHRVAAILYTALCQEKPARLPAGIMEKLQRQVILEALRCQDLARELAFLAQRFDEAAIPVLVLKGIPLSLTLYGTVMGRGIGDIDLLVAAADLFRADALLRSEGYERKGADIIERGQSLYLRRIKEITYTHPTRGSVVELHQRLTENPFLLAWDHADLWRRREMVDVDAAAIAVLPRRHLPVYLAIHGAGHCWERLRWLIDLADVLRMPASVAQAVEDADTLGLGHPMREGLALCHHWLGLPVDAALRSDARDLAPFIRRFFMGKRWIATPRPGSMEWLRRHSLWGRLHRFSLRSGRRYRLWELSAMLIWPPDWDAIPLPNALFWLYPVLRPVGWLLRRIQRH